MKCTMCENPKPLKKERITIKYKECGLDNVTLIGITYYKCHQCGEEYFSYGNIEDLHKIIAQVLLRKSGLLTGKEVRFLRKQLGYSGQMFAKLIGYEHETLSRLENAKQPITPAFDRVIRFSVAERIHDRNYDLHEAILKGGEKFRRIELTSTSHGDWKLKLAA